MQTIVKSTPAIPMSFLIIVLPRRVAIFLAILVLMSLSPNWSFAQKQQLQLDGSFISVNVSYARAYSAISGFFTDHPNPTSIFNWNGSLIAHHYIIPKYATFGMGIGHMWSSEPGVHAVPLIFDLRVMTSQEKDALYLMIQYAHAEPLGRILYSANYLTLGIGYQHVIFGQTFNIEMGLHSRAFARELRRLQSSRVPYLQMSCLNASIGYKLFQKSKRKYNDSRIE